MCKRWKTLHTFQFLSSVYSQLSPGMLNMYAQYHFVFCRNLHFFDKLDCSEYVIKNSITGSLSDENYDVKKKKISNMKQQKL